MPVGQTPTPRDRRHAGRGISVGNGGKWPCRRKSRRLSERRCTRSPARFQERRATTQSHTCPFSDLLLFCPHHTTNPEMQLAYHLNRGGSSYIAAPKVYKKFDRRPLRKPLKPLGKCRWHAACDEERRDWPGMARQPCVHFYSRRRR